LKRVKGKKGAAIKERATASQVKENRKRKEKMMDADDGRRRAGKVESQG
jgi:hypothetical protein